jgi:hypothetical protein
MFHDVAVESRTPTRSLSSEVSFFHEKRIKKSVSVFEPPPCAFRPCDCPAYDLITDDLLPFTLFFGVFFPFCISSSCGQALHPFGASIVHAVA